MMGLLSENKMEFFIIQFNLFKCAQNIEWISRHNDTSTTYKSYMMYFKIIINESWNNICYFRFLMKGLFLHYGKKAPYSLNTGHEYFFFFLVLVGNCIL